VSIETRMAIHVAALRAEWENPGSYNEFTKRALEQSEIAQQKSTIDSPADRAVTFELIPTRGLGDSSGIPKSAMK